MTITKYKFNAQQYHLMAEAGVFSHIYDHCLELIKGEIIQMSPIGRKHAAAVGRFGLLRHERVDSRERLVQYLGRGYGVEENLAHG